jgi:chemotaxis protein methyltransferase CheR
MDSDADAAANAESGIASAENVPNGEFGILLDGILERYGYDFRDYARPALDRRIRAYLKDEGMTDVRVLMEKLLEDEATMQGFVANMSVSLTSMFRDPGLYGYFRKEIVPVLRTFPFIRIWHAGCSTGQEVYSMAILMQEEGLYERCRFYATDMYDGALRTAKEGIYSLHAMRKYTSNYIAAGGKGSFSDYYTAKYNNAILNSCLKKNIVFANHNLVTDGSFNEFHVILCRNVLIFFNERLQARVHGLFHQSLALFGYLGLGAKESLVLGGSREAYFEVDAKHRLYRKIA